MKDFIKIILSIMIIIMAYLGFSDALNGHWTQDVFAGLFGLSLGVLVFVKGE